MHNLQIKCTHLFELSNTF